MTSPIFFPALLKNYVVQTRYKFGAWQEHASFRELAQAKRAVQQIRRQNSELEARILNRFTGQIIRT
ncbi:MAG TPA: hypothetical protein PKE64_01370 [Anaerolineae bacterium]|nr:hypothetical protein [Anaerolineae bacterium]HMR62637.1 hypothetical protein [Anaerolineae bacterium]